MSLSQCNDFKVQLNGSGEWRRTDLLSIYILEYMCELTFCQYIYSSICVPLTPSVNIYILEYMCAPYTDCCVGSCLD
jgi:hypothetical protein